MYRCFGNRQREFSVKWHSLGVGNIRVAWQLSRVSVFNFYGVLVTRRGQSSGITVDCTRTLWQIGYALTSSVKLSTGEVLVDNAPHSVLTRWVNNRHTTEQIKSSLSFIIFFATWRWKSSVDTAVSMSSYPSVYHRAVRSPVRQAEVSACNTLKSRWILTWWE
jgi:hypothetical protein